MRSALRSRWRSLPARRDRQPQTTPEDRAEDSIASPGAAGPGAGRAGPGGPLESGDTLFHAARIMCDPLMISYKERGDGRESTGEALRSDGGSRSDVFCPIDSFRKCSVGCGVGRLLSVPLA